MTDSYFKSGKLSDACMHVACMHILQCLRFHIENFAQTIWEVKSTFKSHSLISQYHYYPVNSRFAVLSHVAPIGSGQRLVSIEHRTTFIPRYTKASSPYFRLYAELPMILCHKPQFCHTRAHHWWFVSIFRHLSWQEVQVGLIYFWYAVFITFDVCVLIFMASPLWLAVGPMIIYKLLNVCPFDCTAFVISGKVGIP